MSDENLKFTVSTVELVFRKSLPVDFYTYVDPIAPGRIDLQVLKDIDGQSVSEDILCYNLRFHKGESADSIACVFRLRESMKFVREDLDLTASNYELFAKHLSDVIRKDLFNWESIHDEC